MMACVLVIALISVFGPFQEPASAEVWSIDALASKIAGFGVSGGVFFIVVATVGPATGGAILGALALLGGPFGVIGGLATLGLIMVVADTVAQYGIVKVSSAVFSRLEERGTPRYEVIRRIRKIPTWLLSTESKLEIINNIEYSR